MLKNRLSGIGSLSLARKLVREFNKTHNTNFGLAPDMKITNLPKPTGADTITQDNSFASREQMNGIAAFLRQLLPRVKLYVYNQADFERIKQDYGFNPDAEAFIYQGIIVTSDRLREADILIEEFLHPFVETLIIKQPELYHRLLEEAKIAFPTLYSQIQESYNDYSRTVQDKEIITQALSRYFREDLGKSKKHHNKFEEIANKFIDFIKGVFGLNMDFTKNKYGNQIVPIDRLINIQSLSDMATVLNTSGISFDVSEGINAMGEKRTYHLENQSNKSEESTFKYIDNAISTGNWNEEAITAVNDLIKDIEDGKKQYNRFILRDQQHAFQRGGRIYEAASVILGREIERKRQESQDKGGEREESPVERRKRWEEEGRRQESVIESWAKANELWLNDYEDPDGNKANSLEDLMESQWEYFDSGSESVVYTYDDATLIKTINLSHYDNNVLRVLDKIALHNTLSPNTALEVVGFGRDTLGHFQIVILQPYIQGEELTDVEFEQFQKQLGAEQSEGWYYLDNYRITDLAPYNIKKYLNPVSGNYEYGIINADYQLQANDYEIDNSVNDIVTEGAVDSQETPLSSPINAESDRQVTEEQPFALENYMYLTQQLIPGDIAEWKKPLLERLDDDINIERSQEANSSVIETIERVLNAETEEEAREIVSEEQKRQEIELDNYDKLTKQIDNLYNSDKIELSEIRHIAELVVNSISDEITRLQTATTERDNVFPELKTDLDFTKATRKQIVDALGINTLLEWAKKQFDPGRFNDLDTMWQAWDIVDNWDAIIELGSDVFILNEGFGITKSFDTDRYDTTNESEVSIGSEMYGDADAMSTDRDAARETGSEQEHWQIESRTIDIVNELISNILVKRAIHDCYLKDENGNLVIGRWGIPERMQVRNAVQSILHWTQKSQNLMDMVAKLEAQAPNNRWLDTLIEKLKDPAQTDLQSQFYSVFQKPYQLFGIVTVKNGKYVSSIVNSHPAQREIMNRIKVDFQSAMHPLFIGYGESVSVNMNYLGTNESAEDLLDKSKPITLRRALAYLNGIKRTYNSQGNKVFTKEMAEEAVPYLTAACKILGFHADENLVKSAVMELEENSKDDKKQYSADSFNKMTTKLSFIVKSLDNAVTKSKAEKENPTPDYTGYKPFEFRAENNILKSVADFIEPVTNKLEDTHNSSVYDSGKMYQSYVTPSFMTLLMNKFSDSKVKANNLEQEFITDFYGKSEWFRTQGSRAGLGWRNEMLRELATSPLAREKFEHKVQLNFNKHNFMRNMTPQEYTLSLIAEYFAEGNDIDSTGRALSWYKIPMESNKPSAEFIKFYSYRGETYKENVIRDLAKMFLQELSRIQTVRMRNKVKGQEDFIENFDTNGKTFCFLPFFNEYLINQGEKTKGGLLQSLEGYDAESDQLLAQEIQEKLAGESIDFDNEFNGDTDGKDTQFMRMIKDAIRSHMEQRTNSILNTWEKEGILKEAKKIEHIRGNNVREDVENYLWNNFLMAKNILQISIGDIAFYKNTEDLQKRLAELHSPGVRGNKYARDYNGVQVSDGYYRTVVLKDLRKQLNFQSNLIDNLTEVLNRKILNAPEYEKEGWRVLKDSLVGEHGVYRDVNVTDAQAYSSPTSYRKKALIFGKWSREAENVYQKLVKGEATLSEIRMAFQPLKPFVYGMLEKNLGVNEAPINTVLEPFQAKNSEYLLIMADALLQNEKTSQPNLLRAIYNVMEDSYFTGRKRDADGNITEYGAYNNRGIDTIQFESSIKSALQGAVDVAQHWNDIDGEAKAIEMLENVIYKKDGNGNILRDQYEEDTYVQKTDYDNYCIQQEVPEHFRDHDQTHGSQIRMITPSDLDYYYNPNGNLEDDANIVYYEVKEPNGTVKRFTARQFRDEYESTVAENIQHSYDQLIKELRLEGSPKERNLALSKILRREILSSPRYGIDLLLACTVDKDGKFRIPKGDPIQAKRIEQLCNSIIKNRLNKQRIAGGPIVQVTNFGTDRLSVVFKDKVTGGSLMTETEWNRRFSANEEMPVDGEGKTYRAYKQYVHDRQGGIAYFECFAPVWSREIFDKFTRSDGTIDVEAIENLDPDLLKMIGYRIPTEDKYSCAPLKIKGFLPAIAGEAIMMPYELTTINDSDFDVDKEYVMRKVIFVNTKSEEHIARDLWQKVDADYNDVLEFVRNPREYKNKDALYEKLWDEYIKVAYYTVHPKKGTLYRNNKIVDMTYEVLTHDTNTMKVLNPGGFENLKKPAYLIEAYRLNIDNEDYRLNEQEADEVRKRVIEDNPEATQEEFLSKLEKELTRAQHKKVYTELSKLPTDELKGLCETSKDLSWADTEIQFYRQNAAAASLIGVQAVNKVAHATLEGDGFFIDVAGLCGTGFTITGRDGLTIDFNGLMEIDRTYNKAGNLIGKTLGSTVSGAADAVKDPIYNLVNVNMATVNMMNTLLRFGMPEHDVFMFMAQDVITRAVDEYNKANLTSNTSFAKVISNIMEQIRKKYAANLTSESRLFGEELTEDEMIEGILPVEHPEIDLKVLAIAQKLLTISNVVRNLDYPTRFNSVTSAAGPHILDNLITEYKISKFTVAGAGEDGTHIYVMNEEGKPEQADFFTVLSKHPILAGFAQGIDVAKRLFNDMPAGSTGFRNLLNLLPEEIADSFFNDKKLLDKLSNFYQTYMLVAAGLLNPGKQSSKGKTEFDSYINGFPRYFRELMNSEQYKKELDLDNNAFIRAIQPDMDSNSGRLYLKINMTGLDPQMKQPLIDGWVDLYKKGEKGKDLATKLMIYNIYRGGIGFSPKTFTALISTYLKENFSGKDKSGKEIKYRDIFELCNFPKMNNRRILDQFVRNNWDDYRLVDHIGKTDKLGIDYSKGELTVRADMRLDGIIDDTMVKQMKSKWYISTDKYVYVKDAKGESKRVKTTLLWKQNGEKSCDSLLVYELVKPLGNNGEYLEMDIDDIKNPLTDTNDVLPQEDNSTLRQQS